MSMTHNPAWRRRFEDRRAPVYRFPALHLVARPEAAVIDGSNRAVLLADRSGNSEVNLLCSNASSSLQTVFVDPATALGAGQFTVSMRCFVPGVNPASNQSLGWQLGPNQTGAQGANSCYWALETTGTLRLAKRSAADALQTVLSFANYSTTYGGSWRTLTIRKNGTNWQLFVDGAAVGASSVLFHGETVASTFLALCPRNTVTADSAVRWVRLYSTGLSDAEVLADANGTVQAGILVNCDYATASKLASSFVCATGQTVTITALGDIGARICGERDAVQFTSGKMPVYTAPSGGRTGYLATDGSNDYSKTPALPLPQPEVMFFVGSQVTWTDSETIIGANASGGANINQGTGATPRISVYAGTGEVRTSDLTLATTKAVTAVFNAAASSIRVDRGTITTGDAGVGVGNGLTLGANSGGSGCSNITANEVLVYQGGQYDAIARDRLARQLMRQHRLAA